MTLKISFALFLVMVCVGSVWGGWVEALDAAQQGDYERELKELRPLVAAGHAGAQYMLGGMYDSGDGVPKNEGEALRLYRLAAAQGYEGAEFTLGHCYKTGRLVKKDLKEAFRWYTLAAQKGLAGAQVELGVMYSRGEGTTQDYQLAVKWFTRAAEEGNALGMLNLGLSYEIGQGVPQDFVLAHKWYNLSAAHETKEAFQEDPERLRARVQAQMTPAQIADAQRLAREWKPKISP